MSSPSLVPADNEVDILREEVDELRKEVGKLRREVKALHRAQLGSISETGSDSRDSRDSRAPVAAPKCIWPGLFGPRLLSNEFGPGGLAWKSATFDLV